MSLRTGYVIVYQVPGGGYESAGLGGQSEAITRARYQIVGVGIQRNQAERAAERAIKALVDSDPAPPRDWLHPLTVTGATVIDRRRAGTIPLDSSGGAFTAGGYVDITAAIT